MQIDTTSYRSPNYSPRPLGVLPSILILHSGEGSKASDLATLCNNRVPEAQRVSAHYYVDRAANVYELVDPALEAWHAGASSWIGRTSLNHYSIGIETEHKHGQAWPNIQREALAALCRHLIARYDIHQEAIAAHRWIAPGRKSDPTNWPDAELRAWIAALYAPQQHTYLVRGLRMYHDSRLTQPADAYLLPGQKVTIDRVASEQPADYAPGAAHRVDSEGGLFFDLNGAVKT